jgi:hypothetical protein
VLICKKLIFTGHSLKKKSAISVKICWPVEDSKQIRQYMANTFVEIENADQKNRVFILLILDRAMDGIQTFKICSIRKIILQTHCDKIKIITLFGRQTLRPYWQL